MRWDQPRQGIDAQRAGAGRNPPVGRDGHHIAQVVGADGCPQTRVGAIDLITGHPGSGNACGYRPVDQLLRQFRFGRKATLALRDSRISAAAGVLGPGLGQIQSAVDQGVSARGCVGQIYRHLGVLNAPGRPGVLPLNPDAVGAFLDISGLVDDQDRPWVAEGVDDVVADIVTHRLGIPAGPAQQVLKRVRRGGATVLSDGPAIFRSRPETIPASNSPAWRSGSKRAKRGAMRSSTAVNSACQRWGSTL